MAEQLAVIQRRCREMAKELERTPENRRALEALGRRQQAGLAELDGEALLVYELTSDLTFNVLGEFRLKEVITGLRRGARRTAASTKAEAVKIAQRMARPRSKAPQPVAGGAR
jgi:hypothetical protein